MIALKLDSDGWDCVNLFLGLLAVHLFHPLRKPLPNQLQQYQHADNAQQAFSSENASTLHLAIPALEALHRAWSSRAEHPKYEHFYSALEARYQKINEYSQLTCLHIGNGYVVTIHQ